MNAPVNPPVVHDPFPQGAAWLRADFHLHTVADREFTGCGDPNWEISRWAEAIAASGIQIGVITNHNKFDAAEFKTLRKQARKQDVFLLPGVELSVKDGESGVHMLVVFGDEWLNEQGRDYINQFLAVAFAGRTAEQYERENESCNFGLIESLEKLEQFNRPYFCVMAHVERSKGFVKELGGGRIEDIGKSPLFQQRVLGFQMVETHDHPDRKCRQKVKAWLAEAYPAEVEGCDAKTLAEIGRGKKCFLKVGHTSFAAVRDALLDHTQRVRTEVPAVKHSHVCAMRFVGGKLDGKQAPFSPHLNCLIGIRGSGKSSLLEALRFGLGIELPPDSPDALYKQKLLKEYFLGSGGKVVLDVRDAEGRAFEVHRILGERAEVYADGVLQTDVALRESILRKPLYFGQKDLAANGEGFGQNLVDKLVGERLRDVRSRIQAQQRHVRDAVEAIQRLAQDADKIADADKQLADIRFRLQIYAQHGIEQQMHAQLAYDRAVSGAEAYLRRLQAWVGTLDTAADEYRHEVTGIQIPLPPELDALASRYVQAMQPLESVLNQLVQGRVEAAAVLTAVQQLNAELSTARDAKKEAFAEAERAMTAQLATQGATRITATDFRLLKSKETALDQLLVELRKQQKTRATAEAELSKALAALNALWHEEFRLIQSLLNAVNAHSGPLQVQAEFKGDKAEFKRFAADVFRGTSLRETFYASLAEHPDFATARTDLDALAAQAGGRAEAFKTRFSEQAKTLLTWQPPNRYQVSYHGKPLAEHSLGQRAQALSLFILSQEDHDLLLIDQPEDDLDNQTLYAEVVTRIRTLKPKMQFVLATHNASFPVLGDAEMVVACSNAGAMSVQTGSVDVPQIQTAIIDIMEGGRDAFARRKEIYQRWI